MNTVSVIIPTVNEEFYIERCLSALFAQDYDKPFEIIVVDGYSEDKTKEIANGYDAKIIESFVRNQGYQSNLGAYYSNPKTDLYFFTNADTIVPKNWISRIVEEFGRDKNTVMTGTINYPIPGEGYQTFYRLWNAGKRVLDNFSIPIIPGCSMAILKDTFYRVGGFSRDVDTDADMTLKARRIGNVRLIHDTAVVTSTRGFKRRHGKFIKVVNPLIYRLSRRRYDLRRY